MSEKIVDKCPSCGSRGTLFVGKGGYLTCGLIGCPEPGLGAAIAQLRAENAVMREALTKIANPHEAHVRTDQEMAVSALAKYQERK